MNMQIAKTTDTSQELSITMFGGFCISLGGLQISDSENRSQKVWSLLAYLIYFRGNVISIDELIRLLWDQETPSPKRLNSLKSLLHRARSFLDRLEEGLGQRLILREGEGYSWNAEIPCWLDVEQLQNAYKKGNSSHDQGSRICSYRQLVQLYKGDFLPKQASDFWVQEKRREYQQMYYQAIHALLRLLREEKEYRLILEICGGALRFDAYDEELYQYQIESLLAVGNPKQAMLCYKQAMNHFFSKSNRRPSETLQSLYRQVVKTSHAVEDDLSMIKEQLREHEAGGGAFFCEYEFFKDIYRIWARSASRNGVDTYLGLLTAEDVFGEQLPLQKLNFCMEKLQKLIQRSLRKGDVFSRYSPAQYIIMLPSSNYENSCRVMERVIRFFKRENPHFSALLRYSVQPVD
ncbi:MAG: BTAD domain-containing putative transcriptional regulator [Bacillota bacterium]|nr:BTAD domain-containing putative transcriptional regulator [Bacillota bacterium]